DHRYRQPAYGARGARRSSRNSAGLHQARRYGLAGDAEFTHALPCPDAAGGSGSPPRSASRVCGRNHGGPGGRGHGCGLRARGNLPLRLRIHHRRPGPQRTRAGQL
ncbi:hypothetical protein, partial [Arthrobacter sp. DR-2P]